MIFHHWDLPFAGSKHVIMNGIDLTPVKQLTIEPLIRLRNEYDIIYTCSANWHRQKRLKENVECFFNLQQQRPDLKSCLLILGSNPDYAVNNPHVFYAGSQSYDVCQQIFAASNWFIHLAWLDHCPNVVVEAISQGTPVICSDSGGTKEIVRNYGVIVKEERDYKFELTNYDEPPKIDVSKITLPNKNQLGQVPNVDIKECAKKYVEVFESVLNEKLQS
jgi:glycosyltransferase involved in cell wall biosynthesis